MTATSRCPTLTATCSSTSQRISTIPSHSIDTYILNTYSCLDSILDSCNLLKSTKHKNVEPTIVKIYEKSHPPKLRARTQRIVFDHSCLWKASRTAVRTFFALDIALQKLQLFRYRVSCSPSTKFLSAISRYTSEPLETK